MKFNKLCRLICTKRIFLIIIGINLLLLSQAYSLVPLESLIYGDFSESFYREKSDPVNYVFMDDESSAAVDRSKLARFVAFMYEGENLKNYCKKKDFIKYKSDWARQQTIRSILATLQSLTLDLSIKAIVQYAKYFEFSEEEFGNLVERLIGNYCSKNLSSISLRELQKNLMVKFEKGVDFQLPTIDDCKQFPTRLKKLHRKDKAYENEFLRSVRLFRSACSWGGDTKNLGLMVSLVRHPVVMAYVFRQLSGFKVAWEPVDDVFYLEEEEDTVKVLCQNLICRKVDKEKMDKKFPRSLGHDDFRNDFDRLYCQELRDVDYMYKDQVPQIKKWIDTQSFDDQNFLVSIFISLITGIPDFFIRSEKFSEAKVFLRTPVDEIWDRWAQNALKNLGEDVYYEEFLTLTKVDRKYYYNFFIPKFKVIFDVNLGEYDRLVPILGKITTTIAINVSKSFLRWIRFEWGQLRNKEERKRLKERFKVEIEDELEKERKKFYIPPWSGDLGRLIVAELLEQLVRYQGDYFQHNIKERVRIPIIFNYGIFALKYLHYQYQVKLNEEKYN